MQVQLHTEPVPYRRIYSIVNKDMANSAVNTKTKKNRLNRRKKTVITQQVPSQARNQILTLTIRGPKRNRA